ncbi:ead/Ea22-like family protein [Citrobacter freundii]|uniref:Ead/Ea22-like family protein n=1 Tax=Citrobacter youngae TaxID=133448 RepID=A0A9Q7ZKZ6_9ENTR|nr:MULTISPECIES: ead/Ea22-like family protein [Citrobacter freundii complex]KWZ93614.1 hypothetical protein HMPREF3212_00033 [Citrobacter freundii]MCO8024914.1 ead/Ea22-like family protein [Citrobacter freundii]MCO8032390.1 ead/Ea22-like family protein [Citrobacter freundii]MCO8037772.1 ead/Ea22-like family protein [Citrobacter freundii]MCS0561124.1 ead/Ea22-like family protein [Citrobacter freundii]
MTALNKQALREAAEKALPAMKRLLMMPNDELFDEALLNVDGDVGAANAFNLIAGPETMLALLDENLQLQRDKDSLEAAALAMRDDMREAHEKLEAAEKRIAELSASHSKLRDTMATIHNTIRMDGGYTPLAAILNAAKRAHEESASAAGIGVKGE